MNTLANTLVEESLAENTDQARSLMYLLHLKNLSQDEAVNRVRLYKKWKNLLIDGRKIDKVEARMNAIKGKKLP